MLAGSLKNLYIYVVTRDFGFAPNPFHGYCTLATCKPMIRKTAQIGDWVMGVGGSPLKATGKCIYLMNITEILTFETYWSDSRFFIKRPVRNGSPVMMVGDNIYHKDAKTGQWIQEDSHHSEPDGTMNTGNVQIDTRSDNVLISERFFYFGSSAPCVDLPSIGYTNGIGHSKKPFEDVAVFLKSIEKDNQKNMNIVVADPFNFEHAAKRVDQGTRKIR
ncbi:MAG: Nmad2 family putative nucleotide modification protein [Syntrophorhabdaceae bacterium]